VGAALPRRWFDRPSTTVAPSLIGRHLVRRFADGSEARVRLVETEAYRSDDPASHSFRGPTARNRTMFGPAGHLYVYLIYGMHHCLNVVTGGPEPASAVLLRAAEPLENLTMLEANRGVTDVRALCRGPGRLAQALAVDRSFDGIDLLTSDVLWIEPGTPVPRSRLTVTPRVGISVATERPWRWLEAGSPWTTAFTPRPAAGQR
jgi:DNA-3-methyladenine glycosylase